MATDRIMAERQQPEWRKRTYWSLLDDVAARYGPKDALVTTDTLGNERRVTYSDLVLAGDRLAAGLVRIGVRRGDRVGLWMTNLVEWVTTYLAVLKLGATLVPINTWLKRDEIAYMFRKARVRHLVMLDTFRKLDFVDTFRQICPEWEASRPGQLFSNALPELRNVVVFGRQGGQCPGAFAWTDLARESDHSSTALVAEIAATVSPSDVAQMKFTSGSTGFPKGVLLEQWGIVTNALLHTRRLELGDHDVWFSPMPFFHAGGSVWGLSSALSRGSTLVFLEAWDGDLALDLIERERCSVFWAGALPMILDAFDKLEKRKRDVSSLRVAVYPDRALVDRLREKFGVRMLFSAYGVTEAYGPVSVHSPQDTPDQQGTTNGRALDGVEIRIVDPATGSEAAPGETGEIWVRGLTMRSYFELPLETEQMLDRDGWLHTQDLGMRDADGYVTFLGRLKAMIKVGGENVAAEEVETIIRTMPGVREVCVIGVPDPRKMEAPRAYVVRDPASDLNERALRAWCTEQLANFKVPRDLIFVEALPMTGSAKVDRAAVIRQDKTGELVGVSV